MKGNPKDLMKEYTGGKLADVVIEGTGTGAALGQAIECCKTMGTIVLMGNPGKAGLRAFRT